MAAFVPLNPLGKTDDNVYRVFGNLEPYSQSDVNQKDPTHGLIKNKEEESPSLEFVQKALDKMTAPLKFEVSNLIWSSYFRINERIANGFRKKRAFLIGGKVAIINNRLLSFFIEETPVLIFTTTAYV